MADSSPASSSGAPPASSERPASTETPPLKAFEVVRACLSSRPAAARRDTVRSLVGAGLDWDTVRREAARHRVLPLFDRRVEALLGEECPESVRKNGRKHRRGVRIRNAFLADELGRVVDAFQEADLPVLAHKGPVLSKAVFGDVAARHSVDMDVVIPRARAREADRLLRGLGYEHAAKRAALEGWRKTLSLYLDGQWEFTRGASFMLDLHTRIMPPGYTFPRAPRSFWERSEPVALRDDVTVPGFAPEDRVLVLSHHGVKNQWRILRHVVDIAGALRAPSALDWSRLRTRARKQRATRATQLGLFLAHDLLEVPLPAPIRGWIDIPPVRRVGAQMAAHLRRRHETDALGYRDRVRLQLATKDTVAGQLRYGAHSLLHHLWDSVLRP
ncbi:MAG: nucleotidyltransferase family protein [Salinibacter sp.]|uniref:nucleotidyltransferase domain-containing protein n=1 Tax=Salinibacter sp. TaxID=2065818 RepID=UPI002FC39BC2